ncbi:MAG: FAD-dependent monooxygenase [Candidatus Thiodiazotropha sp.]
MSDTVQSKESSSSLYDVIVVGCGPTGANFANYFRRFGHKVAIFDRDKEVFPAPRATGLDDESMRVYQTLGLDSRLKEEGLVFDCDVQFQDYSGRVLMNFDRHNLGEDMLNGEHGHYGMISFLQPALEEVLRDDFKEPGGAAAFLGYEVLSVTDCGTHTELLAKNLDNDEETLFRAKYIIGSDGGRSMVRRSMGFERIDLGYTEDYLVLDTIVDDEIYLKTRIPDGGIIQLDPKHSGVIFKSPKGNVRFDFLQHKGVVGEKLETDEEFQNAGKNLIEAAGLDPDKFRVIRHAPYRFYAGMSSQWRKGRLFVAGDAAHLTPPWSGQGLNAAMRDCSNLSFKLHLVLSGKASEKILDTYFEERRHPQIHVIKGAVDTGKLMQTRNPFKIALRELMFLASRKSRFVRRMAWSLWRRKPPYKQGLVGKRHKLSGNVFPQPKVFDAKGNHQMLDDLIGLNFALISTNFATGPAVERMVREIGGVVLKLGVDFSNPGGEVSDWFRKNKATTVLVRPDRYIFDAGNDGNTLCEALLGALGSQSQAVETSILKHQESTA